MAKKKVREDRSQTTQSAPFNNPFAALLGKSDLGDDVEALPPSEDVPPPSVGELPSDLEGIKSKIVVRKEKKGRGGKTVTRVEGLMLSQEDRNGWAKRMAKALGCGVSSDGDDLLVQGSQSERVAEWLRGQGARRVVVGDARS